MFIYKITVQPTGKVYIGLDTYPEYKRKRWNEHIKESKNGSSRKLHQAMRTAGADNCEYEVLARDFKTIGELAFAEIQFIKQYDSYKNGLNSSPGGDGIGCHNLSKMTEEEIKIIREALGENWRNYNKAKWKNTTKQERVEMLKHLFTPEVMARKIETQKRYYEEVPGAKEKHSAGLKKWAKMNPDKKRANSLKASLIGAAKASKPVTLEKEDGTIENFKSRQEMQRLTGLWFDTLLKKSKKGNFHHGYRIKDY